MGAYEMSRLIDVDAMNEELFYKQLGGKDTLITAESAFNMIKAQPTAYDISKVVAELEVMEEKRVRFAKQILDYWDKQGTQQTILFLKDIVENSEV